MSILSKTKPVLWLLFSTGGTVAAFFIPVFLLILIAVISTHVISDQFLTYDYLMHTLASCWFLKLCLFAFFVLVFWHGMHRLFLTAVDIFHVKRYSKNSALLFYGSALIITLYVFVIFILL